MRRHRLLPHACTAVLLAALAACDQPGLVTPVTEPVTAPPTGSVALTCTASVAAGTIECRPARLTGARAELLLGGQGERVKLTSTSGVYDAPTQTLRADVTVQNLLSQAIGTPDGATKTGVKVFFHTGPTVTGGSGTVTVQNPDGLDAFTAANQPYFLYDQILQPHNISGAKTWRFTVPSTATTFVFSVYVAAQSTGETGVLRWAHEYGLATSSVHQTAVWGASDSSVFVVTNTPYYGTVPVVTHWDGQTWTELLVGESEVDKFNDVAGTSSSDVWVVGGNFELLHYDGSDWTRHRVAGGPWRAVWAAAPNVAFAIGTSTIIRWNGTTWTPMTVPSGSQLNALWGSSENNVFAVGDGGRILHYNGSTWTAMTSNTTRYLRDVWGSSPTDVWAVGLGGSVHHWNGVSWTVTQSELVNLSSVWGSSATDVYAVGQHDYWSLTPALIHWNGSTWTRAPATITWSGGEPLGIWGSPTGRFWAVGENGLLLTKKPGESWKGLSPPYLNDVKVGSANDVLAVGEHVLHWNGASWNRVPGTPSHNWQGVWYDGAGTFWVVGGLSGDVLKISGGQVQSTTNIGKFVRAVWGTGTTVFAVGTDGVIVRSTGGGAFTPMTSGTTEHFYDVWGTAADNVFAVGNLGIIHRFDGTSWTPMVTGTSQHLRSVHGNSATNVWAVGSGTVLRFDGSTWTPVPTPADVPGFSPVWVAPDGVVYVNAGRGSPMRYVNGVWERSAATGHSISAIDGFSSTDVYAVGSAILHGTR